MDRNGEQKNAPRYEPNQLEEVLEQRDFEIRNLAEKVEILNKKVIFFQNECFKVTSFAERIAR